LAWNDPTYWTKDNVTLTGPNPIAINYHARAYLGVSNTVLRYALDRYCLSPNSCIIACHSAGCAQIGYALATFGVFGTIWNVERVITGGSAAGGSEIASTFADTGLAGFLGRDLEVATMRALYDHDALGVQVDLNVGAAGGLKAFLLPGEDDGAVAYHSAGGARKALAYCNTVGSGCDAVLPVGQFDSATLFVGHKVVFRDDSTSFDHTGTKQKVADWVAVTALSL
jgi:hypothetical protein